LIAAALTMGRHHDKQPTQVANFGHLAEGEPSQAGASGICNLPISKERMAVTRRVPVVR
jgi:hypothetical protein